LVFRKTDRTAEVHQGFKELRICPTDYCQYYEKHPYTILWKSECWTCRYGDFGVDVDCPVNTGTCKYKN
jgi:hypothetical protein